MSYSDCLLCWSYADESSFAIAQSWLDELAFRAILERRFGGAS